jgi:hypothetical protein
MVMNYKTRIKEFFGQSRRDFLESIALLGYVIIANVWTISTIPELTPSWQIVIGFAILGAIGGLLWRGLRGLVIGAFLMSISFAFIIAALFPIFFISYLIGIFFKFLSSIPLPLVSSVGTLVLYLFFALSLFILVIGSYSSYQHHKESCTNEENEDYSSRPSFTMDLWGGRWG